MSFLGRATIQPWTRLIYSSPHTLPIREISCTRSFVCSFLSTLSLRMASNTAKPRIMNLSTLSSSDAKWVQLQKVEYIDQTGRSRVWEVASRKTRGSSGVDAVAIGPILIRPKGKPSTILVLQYRPPLDAITVEWPAGLVDANERTEEAAVRELREETGYAGKVLSVSPTVANDPGMTTANMQLVMVEVRLSEGDKEPDQQLDDGEHIQRVEVPLDELYERLLAYSREEGMMVSAKLFHWAAGLHFVKNVLPETQ